MADTRPLRAALEEAITLDLGGGYQMKQAAWRKVAAEYDRALASETPGLDHPFVPGIPVDEDEKPNERCYAPDAQGRRGLICGAPPSAHRTALASETPRPDEQGPSTR